MILQLLLHNFKIFIWELFSIAKSSATAKFHTNYQINFSEGCDDLIVSGVQKLLTKNNLISIKLLDFLTFGSPYLEQNIFEIKSKKIKNDRHLYYKKQESKKILVIYIKRYSKKESIILKMPHRINCPQKDSLIPTAECLFPKTR